MSKRNRNKLARLDEKNQQYYKPKKYYDPEELVLPGDKLNPEFIFSASQNPFRVSYLRLTTVGSIAKRLIIELNNLKHRLHKLPELEVKLFILAYHYPLAIRPLEDWKPTGKSAYRQYISLVDHLFVRYKPPSFLYYIWNTDYRSAPRRNYYYPNPNYEAVDHVWLSVFFRLALGSSMKEICKNYIPTNLTRKQAHAFLNSKESVPMKALRWAQISTHGGTRALFEVLQSFPFMGNFHADEGFISRMLEWFSKQSFLDPNAVRHLVDYISYEYRQAGYYSFKGRTALSVEKHMLEWHTRLGNISASTIQKSDVLFPPGPAKPFERHISVEEDLHSAGTWSIRPIVTAKQLLEEGRKMKHCVYSYRDRVARGDTFIYSLKHTVCEGGISQHKATIQVQQGAIVQTSGKMNQPVGSQGWKFIQEWAKENSLLFDVRY